MPGAGLESRGLQLILEEAGGILTDGDGGPITYGRSPREHAGIIAGVGDATVANRVVAWSPRRSATS